MDKLFCCGLLFFLVFYGMDCKRLDGNNSSVISSNCLPLEIGICRSMHLYTEAIFPNLLGHRTQSDAAKALKPYLPLLREPRCREALPNFVCSLLAPVCTILERPIPPCKRTCLFAKKRCAKMMKKKKLSWPQDWDCGRFSDQDLCVQHDRTQPTPVAEPVTNLPPLDLSSPKQPMTTLRHRTESDSMITTPSSPIKRKQRRRSSRRVKLRLRRYDVRDVGDARLFHGWADVQRQGAANDYCRVIGTNPHHRFLACALAGTKGQAHTYVSTRGFNVGHRDTWFMRDMDGDGRDDYCRCVGSGVKSFISCMKAGEQGFYSSPMQSGDQYTFTPEIGPCFQKVFDPYLGISSSRKHYG